MTLSIILQPETESRLRRLALTAVKDATAYAAELIEEAVNRVEGAPVDLPNDEERTPIGHRLAEVLNEVWSIQPEPARPASDAYEAAIRQSLSEKFRKQGLKL